MNAATVPQTVKLAITCIECGAVEHAPFDQNSLSPKRLFHEIDWILSVIDPQGIVLAPVCGPCARKIYPPEAFAKVAKALE